MRVAALVALLVPVTAPAYGAEIGLSLASDADGKPIFWEPYINPDVPGTTEVFRCPSASACETTPLAEYSDQWGHPRISMSSTVPGDFFEVRFTPDDSGAVVTVRTPVWVNNVTRSAAPAVVGQPIIGQMVSLAPGVWQDGWSYPWRNVVEDVLAACPDATGKDGCFAVAVGADSVALDPRWEGYYLFAISSGASGTGGGSAIPPFAGGVYPVHPALGPPVGLVSAPVGPIVHPSPPVAAPTVVKAAATASIRARALRAKGRLSVGRVTCPVKCTVKLMVSGGGKTLKRTTTVTGTKALTIPRRRGALHVRVDVDGKRLASGVSKAR